MKAASGSGNSPGPGPVPSPTCPRPQGSPRAQVGPLLTCPAAPTRPAELEPAKLEQWLPAPGPSHRPGRAGSLPQGLGRPLLLQSASGRNRAPPLPQAERPLGLAESLSAATAKEHLPPNQDRHGQAKDPPPALPDPARLGLSLQAIALLRLSVALPKEPSPGVRCSSLPTGRGAGCPQWRHE
ncbi:uncharacterized protein LOC129078837 [Pteronotus mesoamericanus]|uniref:uncharacterized protein LOC129078837 n=1 Tax=Pteronotus mesoamericanus TaxID=1884717 RepID=UPI0023EB8DF0|nr:uncharacterized protein LOC129078837 [Pteronotus parnellii mesoamericanus]